MAASSPPSFSFLFFFLFSFSEVLWTRLRRVIFLTKNPATSMVPKPRAAPGWCSLRLVNQDVLSSYVRGRFRRNERVKYLANFIKYLANFIKYLLNFTKYLLNFTKYLALVSLCHTPLSPPQPLLVLLPLLSSLLPCSPCSLITKRIVY